MDGSEGLGPGLAALETALGNKRLELLELVKQLDSELAAIKAVRAAGQRMGFGSVSKHMPPGAAPQGGPVVPFRLTRANPPSPIHKVTRFPGAEPTGVSGTALSAAISNDLGPPRNDRAIPPAVVDGVRAGVHDVPNKGPELLAVRDSVSAIAENAAKVKPGKKGRRTMSAVGLVHGEPIAPALRVILEVADRPMTSHEVAVAMLEARGIRHEGPKLTAVVSRVCALLVQDRKKKKAHAMRVEGSKELLWVSPHKRHLLPPSPTVPTDASDGDGMPATGRT